MENATLFLGMAILVSILAISIYLFFKLSRERQKEIISEWLLLAVIKAEKELGSGTGQVKLRYVYDLFIDKFKVMSMFITFSHSSRFQTLIFTLQFLLFSSCQPEQLRILRSGLHLPE